MNQNLSVLIGEIKNRAKIYLLLYRELSTEVGEEKANEIMKRAIYTRGKEKGLQLTERIKEPSLRELAIAFVEGKGDMDAFGHEVVREKSDHVILRLNRCPLVDTWKDEGLSPVEIKKMCDIAYQVDFGKFEQAGFKLSFDCRIAEDAESCDLRVEI
jgi:hypothetical protein